MSARRLTQVVLVALWLFAATTTFAPRAHGQGCSQCQDNAAATPPRTQAAYRRAIVLMMVTAGGLFVGTVLLLKRYR